MSRNQVLDTRARLIAEPASLDLMSRVQDQALQAGDRRHAFILARRALCAGPTSPTPFLMMAEIFSVIHFSIATYFSAAAMACKRALVLEPGSSDGWNHLVSQYRGYDRITLSSWSNRLSCVAAPKSSAVITRVTKLFEIGDFSKGRSIARRVLDEDPGFLPMADLLSGNFEAKDEKVLTEIANAIERHPQADPQQRFKGALISARISHQSKDYESAVRHLTRMIKRAHSAAGGRFNVQAFVGALSERSTGGSALPTSPPASNGLGFVMVSGLPRSGTTLMESRLAKTADVTALGETHLIETTYEILQSRLSNRRRAARDLAKALWHERARSDAATETSEVQWYSEKMPLIAAYIGVANALADQVRTIIIVRPFLSTWISSLLTGVAERHRYMLEPDDLLEVYRLHLTFADRCFATAPPRDAAVVTLEGLSEDPDGLTNALCDRFELPVRSQVQSNGAGQIVRTASWAKVRENVSRNVSDQYVAYREYLDPAIRSIVDRADLLRAEFLDRHADRLVGARD
jgi:hypothetical protein